MLTLSPSMPSFGPTQMPMPMPTFSDSRGGPSEKNKKRWLADPAREEEKRRSVRCEGTNQDGSRCNIHACMKSLKEARLLKKGYPLCAHHARQLPQLRRRLETRDCCRCHEPYWVPLDTPMTEFVCGECEEV